MVASEVAVNDRVVISRTIKGATTITVSITDGDYRVRWCVQTFNPNYGKDLQRARREAWAALCKLQGITA